MAIAASVSQLAADGVPIGVPAGVADGVPVVAGVELWAEADVRTATPIESASNTIAEKLAREIRALFMGRNLSPRLWLRLCGAMHHVDLLKEAHLWSRAGSPSRWPMPR